MPEADDNKSLVITGFEEIWNKGNWAFASERYHDDIVVHTPNEPNPLHGLDEFKRVWSDLRTTFPDINMAVQDIFADGDMVAARFIVTGTNTGPLAGMKPTGKRVKFDEGAFFKFRDGKIEEAWFAFDSIIMGRQLGIAPNGPPPLFFIKTMDFVSKLLPKRAAQG